MPLHLRESHSTPPFAPLVTPHSPQVSHAHNLGLGVERPTPKPLWWTLERGWPQHGWPKVDFFWGGGLRGRYALLTYTRSYPPRSPQRLTVASAIHRSLYPEDTLVESPACPNLTATPTTNLYCPPPAPPPPPHTQAESLSQLASVGSEERAFLSETAGMTPPPTSKKASLLAKLSEPSSWAAAPSRIGVAALSR